MWDYLSLFFPLPFHIHYFLKLSCLRKRLLCITHPLEEHLLVLVEELVVGVDLLVEDAVVGLARGGIVEDHAGDIAPVGGVLLHLGLLLVHDVHHDEVLGKLHELVRLAGDGLLEVLASAAVSNKEKIKKVK